MTGDHDLAQAVARANTARHALDLLMTARAGAVVREVGRRLLANLRNFAGPAPRLSAHLLDFDGAVLWKEESPGRIAA